MENKVRQVAYKLWICDLINSQIKKDEGEFSSQFIDFKGIKVSRVNIIANVVEKFINEDKSFGSITLDDGSGVVRLKTWKEDTNKIERFNIGDIVNVVGRPRVYNEEGYIVPEILRKIEDPNFEILRKLELIKLYGKPNLNGIKVDSENKKDESYVNEDIVEEIIVNETTENNRQVIIKLIESLDDGEGTNINDIIDNSKINKNEIHLIIGDLLKEGEIFEIKEGYVKLIG